MLCSQEFVGTLRGFDDYVNMVLEVQIQLLQATDLNQAGLRNPSSLLARDSLGPSINTAVVVC